MPGDPLQPVLGGVFQFDATADEIESRAEFDTHLAKRSLARLVILGLRLDADPPDFTGVDVSDALFLGCHLESGEVAIELTRGGAHVVPAFPRPYPTHPAVLYTPDDLAEGFAQGGFAGMYDTVVYQHFLNHGGASPDIREAIGQRLHDAGIDNALAKALAEWSSSSVVAQEATRGPDTRPGYHSAAPDADKSTTLVADKANEDPDTRPGYHSGAPHSPQADQTTTLVGDKGNESPDARPGYHFGAPPGSQADETAVVVGGGGGGRLAGPVGIMGGHAELRGSAAYRMAAELSWRLASHGRLIVTGGGPGVMEAANLGAYFSGRDISELSVAIDMLQAAPDFRDHDPFTAAAIAVRGAYPSEDDLKHGGLALPTWLYGHEPANLFAGRIGKYFSNAVREDSILRLSRGGIVFAPGWAGTVQEIFQAATKTFYRTDGPSGAFVFLGVEHWAKLPVEALLRPLLQRSPHGDQSHLIVVTDSLDEAMDALSDVDSPPAVHG